MKRSPIILIILCFFSIFFESSCTHEKLAVECDTRQMSYQYNIQPILKNNCYSCHSRGNTAGSYGILLDSYVSLVLPGWVNPLHADKSILIGDITHRPPDSTYNYVPMPYMKHKLDTCSINQIAAWINDGAFDN